MLAICVNFDFYSWSTLILYICVCITVYVGSMFYRPPMWNYMMVFLNNIREFAVGYLSNCLLEQAIKFPNCQTRVNLVVLIGKFDEIVFSLTIIFGTLKPICL